MKRNPYFEQIEQDLWHGRAENLPEQRYYQKIKVLNEHIFDQADLNHRICLLGFCTDLGVIRNQGRSGAKDGPNVIRKIIANLPYHPKNQNTDWQLVDAGNIICPDDDLEKAQKICAERIAEIRKKNGFSCVLGGGHEISWAHYQGMEDIYVQDDFAILNFDAHFDVRPLVNQLGNSGTSFLQIAEHRKAQQRPFHYYCVGIRQQSNSNALFETAHQYKIQYLTCDEIYQNPSAIPDFIEKILEKHQHIYLTICLDAFAGSVAPGVSASSPYGLMPWHVLPVMDLLGQSNQVKAFDIAEYAPNLDQDFITAKLGALLLTQFINAVFK